LLFKANKRKFENFAKRLNIVLSQDFIKSRTLQCNETIYSSKISRNEELRSLRDKTENENLKLIDKMQKRALEKLKNTQQRNLRLLYEFYKENLELLDLEVLDIKMQRKENLELLKWNNEKSKILEKLNNYEIGIRNRTHSLLLQTGYSCYIYSAIEFIQTEVKK
jgi:hypothetical protein